MKLTLDIDERAGYYYWMVQQTVDGVTHTAEGPGPYLSLAMARGGAFRVLECDALGTTPLLNWRKSK